MQVGGSRCSSESLSGERVTQRFCPLLTCTEFDRHELRIYEEVAKVPPFRRKTLVLIGAQGVGRRSLKNKLMVSDPQRYGTTVPCECNRSPVCFLPVPLPRVLHLSNWWLVELC